VQRKSTNTHFETPHPVVNRKVKSPFQRRAERPIDRSAARGLGMSAWPLPTTFMIVTCRLALLFPARRAREKTY
jgi:hypothetical protein